jgi:hypothetical protein
MGYREDVVIVYSKEGWKQLQEKLNDATTKHQYEILRCLNDADKHLTQNNGDHLFFYEYVKSGADDMEALFRLTQDEVSFDEYLIVFQSSSDEPSGNYFESSFAPERVQRISFNEDDATEVKDKFSLNGSATNQTSAKPVDNHTCVQCGNTKCNKTEKSCWKCGSAITL